MTLTFYRDYQELFQGCVAYWDGSLTSDGKLQDIIGGYHGTISGATKTGTDRFGFANKCYDFSGNQTSGGASSYITLISNIIFTSDFTFFGWIKPLIDDRYQTVAGFYSAISGSDSIVFNLGSTNGSRLVVNGASYTTPTESNPQYNTWTCVSLKRDGGIIKYYMNGQLQQTLESVSTGEITIQFLGTWSKTQTSTTHSRSIQGESMFFNTTLSSEQIKMLYDLTKSKYLYPVLPGQRSYE